MRALSFVMDGRTSYGVIRDGGIFEAGDDFRRQLPDLRTVLDADALVQMADSIAGDALAPEAVSFLPPVPNADKIFCIGVNYRPHLEEMGREPSRHPVVFLRTNGSVVGHAQGLVRPRVSNEFDYEGEIAFVIGRRGRHIRRENAFDHVAGLTAFMDGSVRDFQGHTSQFTPGKNFAASGAAGPWLVTTDEWTGAETITLETRVNGETVQQGRLGELTFGVPALIEYLSTFAELLPGDVIATGTPGGVGMAKTPPAWLAPGDTVEVDVGGLVRLANPVIAE